MMGPNIALGFLGLLHRWNLNPKVCARCRHFITAGEGYRVLAGKYYHGRCTDEKQEAEPTKTEEAPPG